MFLVSEKKGKFISKISNNVVLKNIRQNSLKREQDVLFIKIEIIEKYLMHVVITLLRIQLFSLTTHTSIIQLKINK